MMKQVRYIDIILLFVQTVLFVLAGIFSGNCHYPVWVNLTLNALVILEAVAALYVFERSAYSSKLVTVLSFVLLGVSYFIFLVLSFRSKNKIAPLTGAIYEVWMGYLTFNAFLSIYLRNKKKAFLMIGAGVFALTLIVSVLSVLGIATQLI